MNVWEKWAIDTIESEYRRSADTHLIKFPLPSFPNIGFYLKDESTHPTGSLKHRLARSLFLYGICNGLIKKNTTIVVASSGSTAVSEAYFAQLLELPFIAIMPEGTSIQKIKLIEHYQGTCHFVSSSNEVYATAERLAKEKNGHYMDQFTYAERATDWRGNNNIAESLFYQMERELSPIPQWIIMSAGTGGTSATLGRYIRYKGLTTQLCVADPEHSVFYDYFYHGDSNITIQKNSNIEGIGRPRVEPSFVPTVINKMIKVPDSMSFATSRFLEKTMGRRCGPSTGTNVFASFLMILDIAKKNINSQISMVSFICDAGDRYSNTIYNDKWLESHHYDLTQHLTSLDQFYTQGTDLVLT